MRFTNDNHHVISLGGADHGIFQWRFLPQGVELAEAADEKQEDERPLETGGTNELLKSQMTCTKMANR